MAILDIITAPDQILRQKATAVDAVNGKIRQLMDDMLQTMYHSEGVGLAAPQVGVSKRVIVVDLQNSDTDTEQAINDPYFMVNPEIVEESDELVLANEGCLSLPEQKIEVSRPAAIKVKFLNYNNESQEMYVEGWLARCVQHEVDHLNGKLLIDYLSKIKKDVMLRKLTKLKKCL